MTDAIRAAQPGRYTGNIYKEKKKRRRVVIVVCVFFESHSLLFAGNYEDGLAAIASGDFKTAFEKLQPLAEQGNANAQYLLGRMYSRGEGVTQNYK